ncbi:MAG TPA: hypothetical protein VJA18_01385 [Candidatus Nanoarchaeia archaeon]|nr:hypothetical protein [Candidatus Nanoarchaeia archaeon]
MDPSFTEIMHAAGIAGFDKLTSEDIEQLIQEGNIQSAYSHVRDLDEFYGFRNWAFCDMENWEEFKNLLSAIFSLKYDSLGELLQTANFFGEKNNVEEEWRVGETFIDKDEEHGFRRLREGKLTDDEKYFKALEAVQNLGINPRTQQPFLVQGIEVPDFLGFVEQWYNQQDRKRRWNPTYAKPLQEVKLYDFIGTRKPETWIKDLGERLFGTVLDKRCIYLPFDGWTLAECFKRHYELK